MEISIVSIVSYLVIVIIALTIHEFCHAWASHLLGDVTAKSEGRLTLNPASHIDPFSTLLLPIGLILLGSPIVFGAAKPVPFNPYSVRHGKWGVAIVAAAGPLSNLVLAVVVGLYLRFFSLGVFAEQFLLQFVIVNLAFFVFNMIPFPPLDGSRIVYAAAPDWLRDIMDNIERYGLIAIIIFMLLLYRFLAPFISTIVLSLAQLILGTNF